MESYTKEDYKRRLRSLTESILLVSTRVLYDDDAIIGLAFTILGSKNDIYKLTVWGQYGTMKCSCSCPDYTIRNRNCKHVYWLGSKKFNNMDPDYWSTDDYDLVVTDYWVTEKIKQNDIGRNESCPICLELIDYNIDTTVVCERQCKNAVHSVCWDRYYAMTGSTQCVVCRTNPVPHICKF